MSDPRAMLNTSMTQDKFSHLYDDGDLSMEAKIWYLDVVDGHIDLLVEQRDDFFHLLDLIGRGEFYESAGEAFFIAFPRMELKFHQMAQEDD